MNARWLTAALMLLAVAATLADATNDLAAAQAEGRDLARRLCELRPAEDFTNSCTLILRARKSPRREIPLRTVSSLGPTNWTAVYETLPNINAPECQRLTVTHRGLLATDYALSALHSNGVGDPYPLPVRELLLSPFADSDFWVMDLGLEFLHWPAQQLLKKELKKGQSCAVLESRNPESATNSYSRVVSWIDIDTGGIVLAEAYDAKGKLLKEFEVKEAEKVAGQWQVSELQMRNVQTRSRTTLKFNFGER